MYDVADERIVAAAAATITFQGQDQDGEPGDPGTVTVGVTASDGSTVVAAGTATTVGDDLGVRTAALTAAQTADVDQLSAVWTASGVVVGRTLIDVVGGVHVRISDVRLTDRVLRDRGADADVDLRRARTRSEQLIEKETGVAWVPRFDRIRVDGTGRTSLSLPDRVMLREVVWARLWTSATEYTSLTADELAAIPADDAGIAERTDGAVWPCGRRNVEVGFVHGYSRPNEDIADACRMLLRDFSRLYDNAIATRQTGFSVDGVFAQLVTAGVRGAPTSNPEVNAVLTRHDHRTPGIA